MYKQGFRGELAISSDRVTGDAIQPGAVGLGASAHVNLQLGEMYEPCRVGSHQASACDVCNERGHSKCLSF